ncbi:MTAP family purine nucleoside phosphorylase [Galbitalea soli]|uniref:Purine nucleoside phosphorylase n=1 Tax=Galbitalea soli TaxID=1268042 RepID=A0A7C9PM87_9MICO|nr:MTAP family purine nucleoside phosphorylase [Galbitalea soli]NEM90752.1 MTAP family purine nucleoside phosphorylase [Galbitalea soli]NYJ31470.1 5'-methylthioadenosine phosphorylase [Galbitalea soli]
MTTPRATVAVIGGSGLYRLFDPADSTVHTVDTPYGPVAVTVGELGGRPVAFLTRHGADHSVPPHLINYRANIWALASIGVTTILSSSAVGGVSADYPPGTLVLTDQYIDRTHGRPDTFYDRGRVQHLASADPFDPELHEIAARALDAAGETFARSGTVVVVQGPRFSTRAESLWFAAAGAHTVNMTMVPEVPLASELGIGTVNLSFVTDSDAGLAPAHDPENAVSHELVLRRLRDAQPRIIAALEVIIRALPADYAGLSIIPADAVAEVLARPVLSAGADA